MLYDACARPTVFGVGGGVPDRYVAADRRRLRCDFDQGGNAVAGSQVIEILKPHRISPTPL